jgi:hypothetical protein
MSFGALTVRPESAIEPKVIEFDYYDGAAEGFAECLLDGSDCCFTLCLGLDQDDRCMQL